MAWDRNKRVEEENRVCRRLFLQSTLGGLVTALMGCSSREEDPGRVLDRFQRDLEGLSAQHLERKLQDEEYVRQASALLARLPFPSPPLDAAIRRLDPRFHSGVSFQHLQRTALAPGYSWRPAPEIPSG